MSITIVAYDYETEERIWKHNEHEGFVEDIEYAEIDNKDVVFSASGDDTVLAYDYENEVKIWQHEIHDDNVYSVHHAEIDGKHVVFSGSGDNTVIAYDYEEEKKIWQHEVHGGVVNSIDYAEIDDRHVVFSGSRDSTVLTYDYEEEKKIWQHEEHGWEVCSVHHADIYGRDIVLSGSFDNTVVAVEYLTGTDDIYEGEFVWQTEEGDVGERNIKISSEDDEDEATVIVLESYDLTIEEPVGEGDVYVNGEMVDDFPYSDNYVKGEEITLLAEPAEGWKFDGWTGDYEGDETEITLEMDQDKEITAHFKEVIQPPEFELSDLRVEPEEPDIGDDVEIMIDVSNVGGETGEYTVVFYVDGNEIGEYTVMVGPESTETASTTYTIEDEGDHEIEAGDESLIITAEEEPDDPNDDDDDPDDEDDDDGLLWWILPIVAVVVIALVLVVFFMKRKKDEDEEEEMSFEDLTSQQAPPPSAREETRTCPGCGQDLRYIEEYQRWWCDDCEGYR